MPLKTGKSKATLQKNIRTEINAGKDPKQAAAIAYSKQRGSEDDDTGKTFKIYDKEQQSQESSREYDVNGWAEVKGNPISKVGVFPYMGRDISPDLDPDRIYHVYRPEEELSNEETIKSFKLLPWTDEHQMLGSESDGLTAPEKKGVHGVIGEDVYFEDGYLKANIKVFSRKLSDLIDKGKKELSIGYRCLYDMVSGVYNGERYDAIQRSIRGNHLASVEEGRSGHDVAVLDHFKFSFDSKELKMPDVNKKEAEVKDEEMSLEECYKMIKALSAKIDGLMNKEGDEAEEGEAKKETSEKAAAEGDAKDEEGEYKKFVNKAEVADEDETEKEALSEDEDESKKDGDMSKSKDKAMDSRITKLSKEIEHLKAHSTKELIQEISRRDSLVKKLSAHVGTFDHANKTFDEVAKYGVKKLNLRCQAGHEAAMLEGYLAASKGNSVAAMANDSQVESSCVDAFLNGGK